MGPGPDTLTYTLWIGWPSELSSVYSSCAILRRSHPCMSIKIPSACFSGSFIEMLRVQYHAFAFSKCYNSIEFQDELSIREIHHSYPKILTVVSFQTHIRLWLIFGRQIEIFLMKSVRFLPFHRTRRQYKKRSYKYKTSITLIKA